MKKNLHRHAIELSYDTKTLMKSNDVRIFRGATLITPGTWTDSVSRRPITYTEQELSRASRNWITNNLNIDHDWSVSKLIGTVQNTRWQDNSVKGDLYINPITSIAKDTVALIDAKMVSALSVELQSVDKFDDNSDLLATDIDFIGCAVVYGPRGACEDARI